MKRKLLPTLLVSVTVVLSGCTGDSIKPAAAGTPAIGDNAFMTPEQKKKALADDEAGRINMEIRQGKRPVPTSATTAPGGIKTGP